MRLTVAIRQSWTCTVGNVMLIDVPLEEEGMTSRDYPVEKTKLGDQYLIPGTEQRTRPKSLRPECPLEGDQYALPGTEPISTREHLSRLAEKPLQPRRAQLSPDTTALFRKTDD